VRKILIDTNLYCDACRGEEQAVEVLRYADQILVSPIIIGELKAGFKIGKRYSENIEQLSRFLSTPRVRIIAITEDTADRFAHVYALLRKVGTPIPTNDIWIAASSFEHGAELVSNDRHFSAVPGLLFTQLG
jgi:tRNA(fMet)-specific endonuclease VapC